MWGTRNLDPDAEANNLFNKRNKKQGEQMGKTKLQEPKTTMAKVPTETHPTWGKKLDLLY